MSSTDNSTDTTPPSSLNIKPIIKKKRSKNTLAKTTPKKFTVKVFYADGTKEEFTEPKSFFGLEWLQNKVSKNGEQSYIETFPSKTRGHTLIMNEEGRFLGLPVNKYVPSDYELLGTVILVPNSVIN
jgi:hypothetical protein